MADENKDNSDIYQLRDSSTLTEKVIAPPENSEIFAIKESVMSVTLGAGVFLCDAYRLDKRLSCDETGETWKASDLQASRNVVVYLPPLEMRLDEPAMESVKHTARHVEALEHPQIVPLLDNFSDPEHGFFAVQKFVNGKTLDVYRKEYIKRYKKFTPAKILKILSDVARALDYAHSADVVHGNLYPKSIIIGLDDEVNVFNFALLPMQMYASTAQQPYLAPEIVEGLAVTAASDIYALAVVAYELFSGRLPIPSDGMEDTPLPLPDVPSSVDTVIRKAMTKAPDDRYDSCGDFVKALEISFQGSARMKSAIITPSSASSGARIPAALLYGIVLTMVLCIAGIAIWQTQPKTQIAKQPPIEDSEQQSVDGNRQQQNSPPTPPKIEIKVPIADPPKVKIVPEIVPTNKPVEEVPVAPVPNEESFSSPDIPVPQEQEPADVSLSDESSVGESENITESDVKPVILVPEIVSDESNTDIIEPETPSPEIVTTSGNLEQPPSNFSADTLREDGEQKSLSIGGIEYRFRWCKSESYLLGTNGFWIQDTPVTQAMWLAVMKTHVGHQPDDVNVRLPEVSVSWNDVEQFLEKINVLEVLADEEFKGRSFALPTEKQWEQANPHNKILEWCNDWSDEAENNRVVRGKEVNTRRDPLVKYENVGFRLVIVQSLQ